MISNGNGDKLEWIPLKFRQKIIQQFAVDSRKALELLAQIKNLLDASISSCEEILVCQLISEMTNEFQESKNSGKSFFDESLASTNIQSTIFRYHQLDKEARQLEDSNLARYEKVLSEIFDKWQKVIYLSTELTDCGKMAISSYHQFREYGNKKNSLEDEVANTLIHNNEQNNVAEILITESMPLIHMNEKSDIIKSELTSDSSSTPIISSDLDVPLKIQEIIDVKEEEKEYQLKVIDKDLDEECQKIKCIPKKENSAFGNQIKDDEVFSTSLPSESSVERWEKENLLIGEQTERQKPVEEFKEASIKIVQRADDNMNLKSGLSSNNSSAVQMIVDEKEGEIKTRMPCNNSLTINRLFGYRRNLVPNTRARNNMKGTRRHSMQRSLIRCRLCNYESVRSYNVIRHEERFHQREDSRSCCGIKLKTKYDWYVHCETAHSERRTTSKVWKEKYQRNNADQSPLKPKYSKPRETNPKSNTKSLKKLEPFFGRSRRLLHAALRKEMSVESLNQVKFEDVPLIYLSKDPMLRKELQPSINNPRNKEFSNAKCLENQKSTQITKCNSTLSQTIISSIKNSKIFDSSYAENQEADPSNFHINSYDSYVTRSSSKIGQSLMDTESQRILQNPKNFESLLNYSCIAHEELSAFNACNDHESNKIIESNLNDLDVDPFENQEFTLFDLSNIPIHFN